MTTNCTHVDCKGCECEKPTLNIEHFKYHNPVVYITYGDKPERAYIANFYQYAYASGYREPHHQMPVPIQYTLDLVSLLWLMGLVSDEAWMEYTFGPPAVMVLID